MSVLCSCCFFRYFVVMILRLFLWGLFVCKNERRSESRKLFYLKATGQQCRKTWQQQKFSLCLSLSKGGESIPVHQGRDQDSKYYSNAGDIQKQETLGISYEIKSDRLDQWLHKWWTKWGQRSIQTRIWGTALLVECKNCILLNCFNFLIFAVVPESERPRGTSTFEWVSAGEKNVRIHLASVSTTGQGWLIVEKRLS